MKQNREMAEQGLSRCAEDIRETYLDVRDSLRRAPRLADTDGEPLAVPHADIPIEPAEAAFRALAPLAPSSAATASCRVEIPWVKKGNRKMGT